MCQGFAFRIKGSSGRWRDGNGSNLGKNQTESLQNIPSAQPDLFRTLNQSIPLNLTLA
jgi:hypothetical protein